MKHMILSERLKTRHSFAAALPLAAPMLTLALVFVLTGGMEKAFFAAAWNWWYIMLLPGMLSVLCCLNMAGEKGCRYYNLKVLPVPEWKLLLGKIAYLAHCLFLSNAVLFVGASVGGFLLGSSISLRGGMEAAVLLSLSFLWAIPVYLFLSTRFGMFAAVFSCLLLSACGALAAPEDGLWWTLPPAIPLRLMCPVLGLHPNGLPLIPESELWDQGLILPGAALSLVWFAILTALFILWFEKREVK